MIALLLHLALAADCTVVQGATVHLPAGPARVSVVIRGDRIAEVGAGAGAGCAVVDGKGKELTAGLVEVSSSLGEVEVSMERNTVDAEAGRPDPIRAATRVLDVYNPRSTLIPVTRIAGVTTAVVNPGGGGRVSGQAGAVDLAGATQAEAWISPSVAMVASMDGASRADGLLELREALDDARAFARNRAGYDKGQAAEYAASRLDLEALQPVLRGELPLVIGANRASDLEALVRFAAEQKVRVIAVGAAEGWMVAPALAAAKIPVVLDPMVYGPGGFDQVHARPDNAKRLADAGVSVVLSSFSSHNARTLSQVAGNAVRGGMDHAAALRAITETPARVFGLGDRGRVEPGAVANLVLWGGDPLELLTPVEAVWIRGRPIALESRQTALQQKYRTMPGTPLPPLAVE